jgi:hypothetical protein
LSRQNIVSRHRNRPHSFRVCNNGSVREVIHMIQPKLSIFPEGDGINAVEAADFF